MAQPVSTQGSAVPSASTAGLSGGGRVLVVDDDEHVCAVLIDHLERRGQSCVAVSSPAAALQRFEAEDFDVVLTDLTVRGMTGLDLCRRVVDLRPDVPVLVLTAFGSMESAVGAIRAGAYDFITKPIDLEALSHAVERALQHHVLRREVQRLRREIDVTQGFEALLGESAVIKRLYELLARIAESDASVLISGESGTGKELVARALHRRSGRASGPFITLNCAAVPETLLESELFGHVKGAFTDARVARTGLFVQAHGGTLFLDEIGDMPLGLQPKLLRALQERLVRPIGSATELPVDVRIVAASHHDLEEAIEKKRFREDLYFRINVIHVELPPLRARGTDILLLAQHFLRQSAQRSGRPVQGLSPAAAEKLLSYPWPGNVRELQNCMERAVALTRYDRVGLEDLPDRVRQYKGSVVVVSADNPAELLPMEEVERRYVLRVLEAVGGNKATAARILGFDRKTLYRKLERYGVGTGR